MPKDVRIWEVHAGDELAELTRARLDLEERVETWLEQDISIISDDLLVIGRQACTGFGGAIDLHSLNKRAICFGEVKRSSRGRGMTRCLGRSYSVAI